MTSYSKPLPIMHDEVTRKYWEGCRNGKLLLQKCQDCGTYQTFPRNLCYKCHLQKLNWVDSSGRGTVYSFSIVYRPPMEEFAPDVPYVVAIVELEEGVRMMTNIVGCAPDDVTIGMKVQVVFARVTAEVALPKFRPV